MADGSGELREGSIARVEGLAKRTDLNGLKVVLLRWHGDVERWATRCEATGEIVRVRPTNLIWESEAPAAEVKEASDACGSGETLQSLGVPLSAVLPGTRSIDIAGATHGESESDYKALLDADGINAFAMQCRFCGCSVLPKGKVKFVDTQVDLPPLPSKDKKAASIGGGVPMESVSGFWHVKDKFDFDNMGVTRPIEGGLRYIICAECDIGPIGWFRDETSMHVALERVRYR
uniref:Mss4-like protein n=1 Tax=Coccolithus braarudii TaxID=221442 RepID=A0A7S0LSU6_9EUKA|mmetsp:Transcript_7925/g.17383  ORF Transcript_7925/g.17383 Transcript_7925/m.17383 type:complete len:233 (+) Transcript_7925:41-739(+)